MKNQQDRSRSERAQLGQGNYVLPNQQQTYVSEAPFGQWYAPAGTRSVYADHEDLATIPFDTRQASGVSSHTVDDGDDDLPEEETGNLMSSRRQTHKRRSKAMPMEGQPKSKRAERREQVAKENHEVSARDQAKGLVEWRGGIFNWWDPKDKQWLKAAYHQTFRDHFIREDRAEGPYVVAPDRGKGANDITSACSAFNQLFWRLEDRDSWANVVDAEGNQVLYLINRPDRKFDEPDRLWIHDGNVLLDGDNNPVRPWAGIPRCFSSQLEGGRIEALRRILPLTIHDLRARMLHEVPTRAGIGAPTKPLSYPSTFSHRASRFRDVYQIPTWLSRASSSIVKKQIMDLLPEAKEATTTEGLRKLSTHEVQQRKMSTYGKYLYKANGRAVSDNERKRRGERLKEKLGRQAPLQPEPSQRLQETPDVDHPEYAAKRGRLSTSPLGPPLEDHSLASQAVLEDPLQLVYHADNVSGTAGTVPQNHGKSVSTTTGLGSNFQGDESINHAQNSNAQLDFRFVEPQNPLEQLRIQAALFYPRTHYHALIGEHPPQSSEGTYVDQYLQIAALLKQRWYSQEGVPFLADVGPWSGSFDIVPTPALPDGVLLSMAHPLSRPPPALEAPATNHHSSTGLAYRIQSSDDQFGEYVGDFDDFDGNNAWY